ncbi:MAG: tetratricopeptide repeat protein [Acidobacteriota bacterium]|nr:MAG: tetratricopeptide repeat protein [Acidobacteriota bacterium]
MKVSENKGFVYVFGKYALNPDEKTLFSGGVPVHLPQKEFETLLYLVEHNGRALSKEQMISAIWQDAFVEEGNLAKQISRLRKMFGESGDEFIETIPKHGYRFTADLKRSFQDDRPVLIEKRTVKRLTLDVETDHEEEDETRPLPPGAKPRYLAGTRPWVAAALLIVAFAAGAYFLWNLWPDPESVNINRIAVLPLRSINDEENGKAIGAGLADALVTKLGSTRRVVVRPSSAADAVSGIEDPVEIGRKLDVDAVLMGTIQQADGRLRVNARLIRTESGEQLWSGSFEQPIGGIFALQDALSTSIAKALAFEFSRSDADKYLSKGTDNPEAYEKYLRGRYFQSQNTPAGLDRSVELYEQAIALDPDFADAHAGIADAGVIMFNFGLKPGPEVIPRSRAALARALKLDPGLSNAHASNALIQFLVDKDWPQAENSLRQAIALNPNNADAFNRYGYFLMRVGRFDEALEKYGKARELNPLSNIIQSGIGLTYLCAGRYSEAISQLEETIAGDPQFSHAQWLLATSYEAAGDHERAFDAGLRGLEIDGGAEFAKRLRLIRESKGLDAANREWFEESVRMREKVRVNALVIAMRAATIKDREETLAWLKRALEEGDTTVGGIRYLSKFEFVRDDPRFQSILKEVPF